MDDELGNKFHQTCEKLLRGDKLKSQASRLVDLVMCGDVALFHTPDHEAYAEIPVMGHRESWPIRSKAFRRWIVRQFYEETQTVPRNQAVQDALLNLEGCASYQGKERMVHLRMAEQNGAIYLDLCDEHWRVVRILPSGWEVLNYSPIAFRRPKGMQPLPIPGRGGYPKDVTEAP